MTIRQLMRGPMTAFLAMGAGALLAGGFAAHAQTAPSVPAATPVTIAIPARIAPPIPANFGLETKLHLDGDQPLAAAAPLDLAGRLGLRIPRVASGAGASALPQLPAFASLAPGELSVSILADSANSTPEPGTSPELPERLQLKMHHSLLVESPTPLTRVSLTDETIAQAIVVSPRQILIQAHAPGEVSLLTWDYTAATRYYTIAVGIDTTPLEAELARAFPHSQLSVTPNGTGLALSGALPDAASAKQAMALAAGFAPEITNNLTVAPPPNPGQVLLQVRFAEVDRAAVSQFGANLLSTGAGKTEGTLGTGQFGAPSGSAIGHTSSATNATIPGNNIINGDGASFGLNSLLNVFLFRGDANLGLAIEALQQQNLVQILAEPNLVAMDGKEASFLAGGEFPFPVVQGTGGVNSVTIEFKPFGVNLHFKPTLLPDHTIDLQVAPEVSALDFTNAVTISGFTIPALSTRRAQTELEIADGQSFLIAGLLDNRLTNSISKLPGLGDLPVLGKLFESHNFNKSKSELMVIVTAHIVQPGAVAPESPKMPAPFLDGGKFDHPKPGGHR